MIVWGVRSSWWETRYATVVCLATGLARYTGKWHEIARLPMYFQRNCINDITATYTRQPDGSIKVDNACRNTEGTMDRSAGVAKTAPLD